MDSVVWMPSGGTRTPGSLPGVLRLVRPVVQQRVQRIGRPFLDVFADAFAGVRVLPQRRRREQHDAKTGFGVDGHHDAGIAAGLETVARRRAPAPGTELALLT